tara:strand:+ start:308 stop:982 length:675 start_codon:yes stop_codon:yes gene_type:complete
MPNLPISGLPASSTLQGDELFADVQGGVTKYTTLDEISAFATSSLQIEVNNLTSVTSSYLTATDTGSLMITGSISDHTLTFTKGDSTTFDIPLPGGQTGPGEATYLIPKNLTVFNDANPIREFYITGSEFNDSSFIKLSWSGPTGTCNVNLPDCTATENVNRIIGFISDGTFASATHADLRPLSGSGQSLDGSPTQAYRINKDYEGIRVWSDGTEWFIIQKKAQ